jgi:hypothetical protein
LEREKEKTTKFVGEMNAECFGCGYKNPLQN